jgi:hypothetical protein
LAIVLDDLTAVLLVVTTAVPLVDSKARLKAAMMETLLGLLKVV